MGPRNSYFINLTAYFHTNPAFWIGPLISFALFSHSNIMPLFWSLYTLLRALIQTMLERCDRFLWSQQAWWRILIPDLLISFLLPSTNHQDNLPALFCHYTTVWFLFVRDPRYIILCAGLHPDLLFTISWFTDVDQIVV